MGRLAAGCLLLAGLVSGQGRSERYVLGRQVGWTRTKGPGLPEDSDELVKGYYAVGYTLQVNPSWGTPGLRRLVRMLQDRHTTDALALLDDSDQKINLSHALLFASTLGDLSMVQELVGRGAAVGEVGDSRGFTPLMVAAENGHLPVVRALLKAGADPNRQERYGFTALHFAVKKDRVDVVQALLDGGADPNLQSELGYTPLNTVQAREGSVALLLAAGADPNLRDYSDRAALHNAAQAGEPEVVRALAEGGALLDAEDKYGDTALELAVDFENPEVVLVLHQAGARL
jgi:ankyrin repeat protein